VILLLPPPANAPKATGLTVHVYVVFKTVELILILVLLPLQIACVGGDTTISFGRGFTVTIIFVGDKLEQPLTVPVTAY
jgi:hypothetical protein